MFIYVITCSTNNKKYVGYDTGPEEKMRRWKTHCGAVRNNKPPKHRSKLFLAMMRYGLENFNVEVVERADNYVSLCELEKQWIKKLDSITNGYNIAIGGQGWAPLQELSEDQLIERREFLSRGSKEANRIRWSNTTFEERQFILNGYFKDYLPEHKSKNVKANWDKMTASEKTKKSRGLCPQPKSYIATSPDGKNELIHGLKQYCLNKGINYGHVIAHMIGRRAAPEYSGYTFKKYEVTE